jgi:phenylacetate-coenzyme A ligase PaaK-like adenylate-forming protein
MTELAIPASFSERPYAQAQFSAMATHARQHHPFYRDFYVAGGEPPLLTREILQANNQRLLNGHPVTGKTSGSTSVPVLIHWGPGRMKFEREDNLRYAGWFGGVLPHAKIVALSAHQKKTNSFEVASPVPEQRAFLAEQIRDGGIQSLISYPTNLVQLAQSYLADNQVVSALRRIVCMSELFESSQEALIRRAFPNAVIASTYSSTEVGMIAGRCPHQPTYYHLMAHKLGIEFLNTQGKPCQEGEVGQIVITDYRNRRMPLIRYAIGDLAAPATCPCGQIKLPALTQLLGKQRGLLKHPNGGHVFSTELSPNIRDTPGIRQYQVQQLAPDRFLLRAIAQPNANVAAIEQSIQALFGRNFGSPCHVEFAWCEHIPRLPGGKYLEFIGLP